MLIGCVEQKKLTLAGLEALMAYASPDWKIRTNSTIITLVQTFYLPKAWLGLATK